MDVGENIWQLMETGGSQLWMEQQMKGMEAEATNEHGKNQHQSRLFLREHCPFQKGKGCTLERKNQH